MDKKTAKLEKINKEISLNFEYVKNALRIIEETNGNEKLFNETDIDSLWLSCLTDFSNLKLALRKKELALIEEN